MHDCPLSAFFIPDPISSHLGPHYSIFLHIPFPFILSRPPSSSSSPCQPRRTNKVLVLEQLSEICLTNSALGETCSRHPSLIETRLARQSPLLQRIVRSIRSRRWRPSCFLDNLSRRGIGIQALLPTPQPQEKVCPTGWQPYAPMGWVTTQKLVQVSAITYH